MFDCNCLIHPFQNDPGTSQRQRIMDELLSGAVKIDARSLASLLDYFVQLALHINYYDLDMNVGAWQPFFKKSIPSSLASVINYPVKETSDNFTLYQSLFTKKPVATGLQLNAHFLYYHFIQRINNWHLILKDSQLPIVPALENLIKDKLREPVVDFIRYVNISVQSYGIKRIDFNPLYTNKTWNIGLEDLYGGNSPTINTVNKTDFVWITELNEHLSTLLPRFTDVLKTLSAEAKNNLELSLVQTKEELQKKHEPHLALLFAFLNVYRHLQDDLNQYTRRHLDFFYKDILQFKSGPAIPDKVHVLFEIQKQLKKYLLNKGLLLKGGKDEKKQEILFGLDDEIVVNKTEVTEKRILFLDELTSHEHTYVEGTYMAPDATKADGLSKDFADDGPKNFSTVGAHLSKYTHPETKIISPYPNARIGLVLASPVLLLKEGTRIINITLACKLNDSICGDAGKTILDAAKNCCNENDPNAGKDDSAPYPSFLGATPLYPFVSPFIDLIYVDLDELLIREAIKKGFKSDFIDVLRAQFKVVLPQPDHCYCQDPKRETSAVIEKADWDNLLLPFHFDDKQKEKLAAIFPPFKEFKLSFSGEKEWIIPKPEEYNLTMGALNNGEFTLLISTTLSILQPSVTYYNSEVVGEDLTTTQPLV